MFAKTRSLAATLGAALMCLSALAPALPVSGTDPYDPPPGAGDPPGNPAPPASAATRIAAGTYNLHGGKSAADVPDVPDLAEEIYRDLRGQDVLVLTEADTSIQSILDSVGPRHPTALRALYPYVLITPGEDVVVLSKLPILRYWTFTTQSQTWDGIGPPFMYRWPDMVTVGLEIVSPRNERFILYPVHLQHDGFDFWGHAVNRGYDRIAELQHIQADMVTQNTYHWPVVVMGDLNDAPNDNSISPFRKNAGLASPLDATWTNYNPAELHYSGYEAIDYAFVTPGTLMYQWLRDALPGASDHGTALLYWEKLPAGAGAVDIARGRPASASSTLEGVATTPDKAVDGDKTPVFTWAGFQRTGFHSGHADADRGLAPVWQVDLGGTKSIARIAVTNRWPDEWGTAGPSWMSGWHAEVLDASGRIVWKSRDFASCDYPTVIDTGGVFGNKVAIRGRAGGFINFAEVEVFSAKRPLAMDKARGWAHSVLAPTSISALVDGDPNTYWSSTALTQFNRQEFDVFPQYASVVAAVRLQARMVDGKPRGLPKSFNVRVLDPREATWIDLGRFAPSVDSSGAAWVNLPSRVATTGVKVQAYEQSAGFEEVAEVELFSEPHINPAP